MSAQQWPFMSVVLPMYNGANVVERALETLLDQDYPRDRFEIIVVDDGSTDNGAAIVRRYPVRLVQHPHNLGIATARNTGLNVARGDVYVCFDDDCLVERGWLRRLAAAYRDLPEALGIASVLHYSEAQQGVIQRFLAAVGSGNAPRLQARKTSRPLSRLVAYVCDQFGRRAKSDDTRPYQAQEIYSASSSFPMAVLHAVGGWDTSLRWMEDSDICRRIGAAFPGRWFWVAPGVHVLYDDLDRNFKEFVLRPWIRGPFNLYYYGKIGVTPPVFPLPLAWLAGVGAAAGLTGPVGGLVVAVVAPQVLYAWWPAQIAQRRNLWPLVFPYLQLAEESATVAGLARGWTRAALGVDHA